jgi:hypothetical protein
MRGIGLVVALVAAGWFAGGCGSDGSGEPADGGASGTLVGSAECAAFCANLRNACGPDTRCDEEFFCSIRMGECAASARNRLSCTSMMTPTCLDAGWSVNSCGGNHSLCTGD